MKQSQSVVKVTRRVFKVQDKKTPVDLTPFLIFFNPCQSLHKLEIKFVLLRKNKTRPGEHFNQIWQKVFPNWQTYASRHRIPEASFSNFQPAPSAISYFFTAHMS